MNICTLIIAILICLPGTAAGQAISGSVLRLTPTSIPATCNTGDIRIDKNSSNVMTSCVANVWTAVGSTTLPNFTASRLLIGDGTNIPSTNAGLTFNTGTGALTATTFVGALTGTASGNLTASPSNHGMLISSGTNAVTVLAPDASTTKVWTSGGSSVDPSWQSVPASITYTANQYGVALSSATNATLTILAPDASTTKVLTSGGVSANPTWSVIPAGTVYNSYSANNHGVVVSGSGTVMSVIAPDASATKVLKSGGASADPTWLAYDNANTASTLVFRDASNNFSAGTITAALTGTASGNLTYSANNHGVLLSGAANVATVVAPNASTSFPLVSGGSSADPTWALLGVAGGGTGQSTIQAALAALSTWTTSISYAVGQQVTYNNVIYVCTVAHTSGASIAADIALGKWVIGGAIAQSSSNLMLTGNTFEDATVGGWVATGVPTVTNGLPVSVGSGGTVFSTSNGGQAKGANTTAAATTASSPIDGINSLNLATSGAGTIGDGYISQSIPISTAYQSKVLTLKFKYKSASGSPVMGGTSANTYAAAVYDVTNNAWLGLAGNFNFTQTSGVGEFVGTVQTASTTAAVQVFIYSPIAPVGASSLLLDNFYLGQQIAAVGPPVTDWTSWTPTGAWSTNTTYAGKWSRVGDTMNLQYFISLAGAPTSATLTVNMPTGYTIDTNKLASTTTAGAIITGSIAQITAAGVGYYGQVRYSSTTAFSVTSLPGAVSTNPFLAVTQAAPGTFANADSIELEVSVPIVGWSSNTNMSADTDTRVVAATVGTGTGTLSGSDNVVKFTATVFDSHAGYSSSTGLYTVPVTGYYEVTSNLDLQITSASGKYLNISIYKNGTSVYSRELSQPGATTNLTTNVNSVILCNAGDTLGIYSNTSGAAATFTSGTAPYYNFMSIKRLSGPAVIAATETVAARYYASATTINGSLATVSWTTKDFDTHSAMSAGTFTVPVAGKYQVNTAVATTGTFALNNIVTLEIQKNGTAVARSKEYAGGIVTDLTAAAADIISCVAGDTIRVQLSSGATGPSIVSSNFENFISIVRVGN